MAGREATLRLGEKTTTVELTAGTGKPRAVARPVLFGTAPAPSQPRMSRPDSLGGTKALKLGEHAPRTGRPGPLRRALFPYHEAWG